MSIHLQPPVPLVTLVKTEPPTVIKNEPLEEALEEEISIDIKDIDTVYHPLSEDLIKSETVLEDILENKQLESVQTQALLVKTENSPLIKTENITQRNKSEDTSDGNVSKGADQGVVEVQASNEHSNALSNLEIDEQSVLNFSKDLSSISVRSRKSKSPKKTDFAECYKTDDTTLWKKEKEKIKVIKAPVIHVEKHEYTSLTKDKHVCNHCQHACNRLNNLKRHIKRMHREVATMYRCPYCPYKSKWKDYIINQHIIQKHKDTKDIQWFQCNLCEMKFKLKSKLTQHMKVQLKHKQMKDGLDLRENRYHCDKCDYKTYTSTQLKSHKLTHLKLEEIKYFYCYHCSYKSKRKSGLKMHIFRHHFTNVKQKKRELQPPVPISLVKIELPTVIKNEPLESETAEIIIDDILNSSESEEEIIPDVKGIDIVYHSVCQESIKSELLESKHYESVETRVLVKAENSPFIKTENITQRNKTEDTSNENVTKGTGQAVVEIQASNEHSNALSNLETDEPSVLNFSKNLNVISVRSRKSKSPKKTDFAECYKTDGITLWKKEKEKIKVIKAPVIPVEAHEYTSLAKDKHVCNHCQHACNALIYLKKHIRKIHREVTTMYQCPYCPYKSKWSVRGHIIQKHTDTKSIQWFQCNLCEKKFKLKYDLTKHKKVHLQHKQIQDGLDLREKRYHCDTCDYKTYTSTNLKNHKINHLKPREIEYFYCYHCSYKSKYKGGLKRHIFRHFEKEQVEFNCYICNFMTQKRESIFNHIKKHFKVQNKSEIN